MAKRFRDAFPKRAPRTPPQQEGEPWAVSEGNARAIGAICQMVNAHPNQILNELLSMAIASSRVLQAQLAFGGLLRGPQPAPAPAAEPEAPAEPEVADERTTEERLAEFQAMARGEAQVHGEDEIPTCSECGYATADQFHRRGGEPELGVCPGSRGPSAPKAEGRCAATKGNVRCDYSDDHPGAHRHEGNDGRDLHEWEPEGGIPAEGTSEDAEVPA